MKKKVKQVQEEFVYVECDISRDRNWKGQGYCGLHGVWIRWEEEPPDLCPVGEMQAGKERALSLLQEVYDAHFDTGKIPNELGVRVERALEEG